jgi:hypothetical protein
MDKKKYTFIFYFYMYMQNISVIFKPSYIWSNIFFNMQKNIMYSQKITVKSVYKILSSCFLLKSYKSFNFFANNENKNNINVSNNINKVSEYDENYDDIDNTYILNIYRNIDDINDIYFSSESLFIDKKIRDREAIIDLSDKSLRFCNNKNFTLNLCDNNEKNLIKNNSFSKKIVYDKNKKIVSINNRKINVNKSKYIKPYIFENPEFF